MTFGQKTEWVLLLPWSPAWSVKDIKYAVILYRVKILASPREVMAFNSKNALNFAAVETFSGSSTFEVLTWPECCYHIRLCAMPPCGAGAPLFPPCPSTSSSFPLFPFQFLSLALPIFFFCPSLSFLPE